ncbi:hypothetical protein LINPERHAP2_LOCUS8224, partial [Linum perenne]
MICGCLSESQAYKNPLPMAKASSSRDTRRERAQLLGSKDVLKPKAMNPDEIRSKYRKSANVKSAAVNAKKKLIERKEKLEKISLRTEELEGRSQDYASLAKELANMMEKKKWWQL